jgi:hypothetical protein
LWGKRRESNREIALSEFGSREEEEEEELLADLDCFATPSDSIRSATGFLVERADGGAKQASSPCARRPPSRSGSRFDALPFGGSILSLRLISTGFALFKTFAASPL